jgi:protein-tyrosine phosphatase
VGIASLLIMPRSTYATMNQIKPHQLWIGNAGDCRAVSRILDKDIRAVVQLAAEESPVQLTRELISCRFPLLDGTDNDANLIDLAIGCVANLVERGIPTLVCCGAGMSRSPAIVAAALAKISHAELGESLEAVTKVHPADVSPGFWKEVCDARRSTL